MPVKIRLMRIGAKKRPFYRVVAVDERNKRTGGYLELLGTYNPLTNPHEIILKQDRIDDWVKKGAVMSDGYLRIIGKAPQRPARKPKREKKEEPAAPTPAQPVDQIKSEVPSNSGEPVVETEQPETQAETSTETAPTEEVPALESPEPTDTLISSDISETPTEENKEETKE